MEQSVIGLISAGFGIYIILARKRFAREHIKHQNKTFKFHFGQKEVKASEFVATVSGTGFIVLGMLAATHVIKW